MSASLIGIALAAALALGTPAQRPTTDAAYPAVEARVHADTLRYSVRAGETLIVSLPSRIAGDDARYEIVEAPALSWLVDRSFMWRTLERERGTLPIQLRRLVAGASPEPIVLLVEITA